MDPLLNLRPASSPAAEAIQGRLRRLRSPTIRDKPLPPLPESTPKYIPYRSPVASAPLDLPATPDGPITAEPAILRRRRRRKMRKEAEHDLRRKDSVSDIARSFLKRQ